MLIARTRDKDVALQGRNLIFGDQTHIFFKKWGIQEKIMSNSNNQNSKKQQQQQKNKTKHINVLTDRTIFACVTVATNAFALDARAISFVALLVVCASVWTLFEAVLAAVTNVAETQPHVAVAVGLWPLTK